MPFGILREKGKSAVLSFSSDYFTRAAFTFPAKALSRKYGCANAPNAANFAERPLAGIHAKLAKLRDNFVIAMRGFACASNY